MKISKIENLNDKKESQLLLNDFIVTEIEWNYRSRRIWQHRIWQHSFRRWREAIESFGFGSFTDKSKRFNREINIACSSNTLVDVLTAPATSPKLMSGSFSNLIPGNQAGVDVYSSANVRGGHLPPVFIRWLIKWHS